MSLRRAVGFLLTRRFSPRVIPRTAPARSFHTLNDLPVGDGLRGVAGLAAVVCAGVGAWAAQYFRKGPDDDESGRFLVFDSSLLVRNHHLMHIPLFLCTTAHKKEEELKAMFENWMKEFNKTYRDEEEKAMRFQVFKDTVKWIKSRPPSTQEVLLPPNCFADLKREERPCSQSCISRGE